jgi:hypothetical protein
MFGLADPDQNGRLPDKPSTADLLIHGLVPPGAVDPVEGIVDAVRGELAALASLLQDPGAGDVLLSLARRLQVAMILFRRSDGREPIPPEDPPVIAPASRSDEPITKGGNNGN